MKHPIYRSVAAVTGCSTDDDTTSLFRHNAPLSTTIDAPPSSSALMTTDDVFLTVIGDEVPGAGQQHIDLAHTVCDALEAGNSVRSVVVTMIEAGGPLTAKQKGAILGAGVTAYCPDYTDELDEFFDEYNKGGAA